MNGGLPADTARLAETTQTHRLVFDRLDRVCGERWAAEFEELREAMRLPFDCVAWTTAGA